MKVESPHFLVPSDEWNSLGIAIRYARCWIIDGRLIHGTKCDCDLRADFESRDAFFRVLNMGAEQ